MNARRFGFDVVIALCVNRVVSNTVRPDRQRSAHA